VLALPEGRGAVHRRPSRRGSLPNCRGACAACEHLELNRRSLLSSAWLRGLPRVAGGGARRVSPRACTARQGGCHRKLGSLVLARPERVRDGIGRRPLERRGDGPQGVPPGGRGAHRGDRERREGAGGRHRPDGVLRKLPASSVDAARLARRRRRQSLARGAQPSREDRLDDARDRIVSGASASAGGARDEARSSSQGTHGRDHRRHPLRGGQACADQALLLLEQPGVRALAHCLAQLDPSARLRRIRAGQRAVRRSHQGIPPQGIPSLGRQRHMWRCPTPYMYGVADRRMRRSG
jgi:hypothetical protein